MPYYLAATIGPIHNTIRQAKSTKAMWTASYIFSYLMREVATKCQHVGDFLIPDVNGLLEPERQAITKKVGLFPDRFFLQVNNPKAAEKTFRGELGNTMDAFSTLIAKDLKNNKISQENIKTFLYSYLNIHIITYEADHDVIKTGNTYLDGLEKMPFFPIQGDGFKTVLLDFFEKADYNCFAKAYLEANRLESFKDLSEIAKGGKPLKFQRQKYVAVCSLDADHIGKLIQSANSSDRIKIVSKYLMDYSVAATKIVENFGGLTVYAGGDDLLFFAPLVGVNNQDIFGLIKDLDSKFEDFITKNTEIKPFMNTKNPPSLSAGISIGYIKYPLREMLDQAHYLLKQAKKDRNSFAFSLRKHSGQSMEIVLDKSNVKIIETFSDLIKLALNQNRQNKILSSMIYKLSVHESVFSGIFTTFNEKFVDQVPHWFDNNFNEKPHQDSDFLNKIKDLLIASLWTNYLDKSLIEPKDKVASTLKLVFTCARYADFLQTPLKNGR